LQIYVLSYGGGYGNATGCLFFLSWLLLLDLTKMLAAVAVCWLPACCCFFFWREMIMLLVVDRIRMNE
jgi:hypothetical protein